MHPSVNAPLSTTSGRSVEVRSDTAGKPRTADSSASVPLSDTTHSASFCKRT